MYDFIVVPNHWSEVSLILTLLVGQVKVWVDRAVPGPVFGGSFFPPILNHHPMRLFYIYNPQPWF